MAGQRHPQRKNVMPAHPLKIVASQCIPRPLAPDDLVGAMLFLVSEISGFVTGQALTVDGGATHP